MVGQISVEKKIGYFSLVSFNILKGDLLPPGRMHAVSAR